MAAQVGLPRVSREESGCELCDENAGQDPLRDGQPRARWCVFASKPHADECEGQHPHRQLPGDFVALDEGIEGLAHSRTLQFAYRIEGRVMLR